MPKDKDKDTWDVSFPDVHPEDIVLWDSDKYSESRSQTALCVQFFQDIKNGYYPANIVVTEENKKEVYDNYFDDWYCEWLTTNRWFTMDEDLYQLTDTFRDTDEYLPSSTVLVMAKGWSQDGYGHKYGLMRATCVANLLSFMHEQVIPETLEEGDEYTILLPKNGTLTLQYLSGPFFGADGDIATDAYGAGIYEGGTVMEFYHIKKECAKLFKALKEKDKNAKTKVKGLNVFCENYITTHGKKKFIETYLDKIDNPIEHAWLGAELDSYWTFKQ